MWIYDLLYLDDVPKAVTKACIVALTILRGLLLVIIVYRSGRVIRLWMERPTITVTKYSPISRSSSEKSSTSASFPATIEAIPMGEYLRKQRQRATLTCMIIAIEAIPMGESLRKQRQRAILTCTIIAIDAIPMGEYLRKQRQMAILTCKIIAIDAISMGEYLRKQRQRAILTCMIMQ